RGKHDQKPHGLDLHQIGSPLPQGGEGGVPRSQIDDHRFPVRSRPRGDADMSPAATTEAPTKVPFVRLDNGDQALMDELMATVADVAARSAFTLGAPVEQFERE